MMVIEYCEHGSLQDYLRANDLLPELTRDQIALDAALGLAYLASRGLLLAASFISCASNLLMQVLCIGMWQLATCCYPVRSGASWLTLE